MPTKLKSSDNHFVQVDIDFATEYGLNEAILCGKLLRLSDVLAGYTDDAGDKWVRLTAEEWVKELPFMGEKTIKRTIDNLEDKGIFIFRTFGGRSKWYRINPEFVENRHNVSSQNVQIQPEVTGQNDQIGGGNWSNCPDVSGQNVQLPIIHSYTIKESSINRERELTPLSQKILDICKLDLEVVKRRKSLREDFLFTAKFLTDKGISPPAVDEFDQWRRAHHWTKDGTVGLMQVCEFWPQYEAWVKAGRQAYQQENGANKNGKHKPTTVGKQISTEEFERQLRG